MKRGLGQPSLTKVEVVLTREQPFTEEDLGTLEAASLVELASMRDEDVADERRVADECDRLLADVKHGDVSVLPHEARQEFERPRRHGDGEAARDFGSRPGWLARRSHLGRIGG